MIQLINTITLIVWDVLLHPYVRILGISHFTHHIFNKHSTRLNKMQLSLSELRANAAEEILLECCYDDFSIYI